MEKKKKKDFWRTFVRICLKIDENKSQEGLSRILEGGGWGVGLLGPAFTLGL